MKNLKQWFEQNYLDGDQVQEGQMLSSAQCLEALQEQREKILEEVKQMQIESDEEFERMNGQQYTLGYDQALSDLLEKLTQLK